MHEKEEKDRTKVSLSISRKRVSLSISREKKAMLDSVKHPGQSYNGLVEELVTFWKEQRRKLGQR